MSCNTVPAGCYQDSILQSHWRCEDAVPSKRVNVSRVRNITPQPGINQMITPLNYSIIKNVNSVLSEFLIPSQLRELNVDQQGMEITFLTFLVLSLH